MPLPPAEILTRNHGAREEAADDDRQASSQILGDVARQKTAEYGATIADDGRNRSLVSGKGLGVLHVCRIQIYSVTHGGVDQSADNIGRMEAGSGNLRRLKCDSARKPTLTGVGEEVEEAPAMSVGQECQSRIRCCRLDARTGKKLGSHQDDSENAATPVYLESLANRSEELFAARVGSSGRLGLSSRTQEYL